MMRYLKQILSILILSGLLAACVPAPATTTETTAEAPPAAEHTSVAAAGFPLTISDAVGQEFTFDEPVKVGCIWFGCIEIFADLGIPPHAAGYSADDAQSVFYFPGDLPAFQIEDSFNPEHWAVAEVDIIITRVPASTDDDALASAAPIFYLHHPSYGESSEKGYQAYVKNLEVLGQLTGKSEVAAAAIERFEVALANLKSLSTPELASQQVAILWEDEAYRGVDQANPFCVTLNEVGLGQCIEAPLWTEINAETFLAIDPDLIIFMNGSPAATERTDPIWSELTAVQEGRVYNALGNRHYCCSLRGLIHALQDYVSHVIPEAGIPNPGPHTDFDPLQSPLVQSIDASTRATRIITHELGVTEVPVSPQRIVALHDLSIANNMLQFGVVPIGAANASNPRSIGGFVLPDTVADVGSIPEPNLEQIAALKPDLIICLDTHANIYAELSAIAPTVSVRDYSAEDALATQRTVADLIGQSDRFNDGVAAYEARITELRGRLAPRQETLEVSTFGVYGENLYLSQQIGWTSAKVFDDLGIVLVPAIAEMIGDTADGSASVSFEDTPKLDADVIFVIDPAWGLENLQATGLLDLTFAAKADQLHIVSADPWYRGGLAGLNLVLDDIEQYLLSTELDTSGDFR